MKNNISWDKYCLDTTEKKANRNQFLHAITKYIEKKLTYSMSDVTNRACNETYDVSLVTYL